MKSEKIGSVEIIETEARDFSRAWKAVVYPRVKGHAIGKITLRQDKDHYQMSRDAWVKEVAKFLDLGVEEYEIKDGRDNVIQTKTYLANLNGEYVMEVEGDE